MNKLEQIYKMVDFGIFVYPVQPNGKIPLKNYSYLKATREKNEIMRWFEHQPNINIGINLKKSGLIVVDIDNHTNDIKKPLEELKKLGYILPSDYMERTQSGGIHCYYKASKPIRSTRKINFVQGVDILTDYVIASPSTNYNVLNGANLQDIAIAPTWIYKALEEEKKPLTISHSLVGFTHKKYTGMLLDEIVQGAETGMRNDWLAHIIGKLLNTGASIRNIEKLIYVINDNFIQPSLPIKEVQAVLKSILKRALKEYKEHEQKKRTN